MERKPTTKTDVETNNVDCIWIEEGVIKFPSTVNVEYKDTFPSVEKAEDKNVEPQVVKVEKKFTVPRLEIL